MHYAEVVLVCLGIVAGINCIVYIICERWDLDADFLLNVGGAILIMVPMLYSMAYGIWYVMYNIIHMRITFGD